MKNKNIILLLLGVFVLSFLFFSYDKTKEEEITSYSYKGPGGTYEFNITHINQNLRHVLSYEYIKVNIKRVSNIPFRYSPMDLEEIYMEDVRSLILTSDVIYIARDYELDALTKAKDGIAILTLARVLDDEMKPDIYEYPVGIALTYAVEDVFSPVVGCDYANVEARVIELRVGSQNAIYKEGDYCVVMEFAEGEDPIKIATKLTYHVLGVM